MQPTESMHDPDLQAAEEALRQIRPDLTLVDRGLSVGDMQVDLVLLDSAGGLVSVILADDHDSAKTVVQALDALRLGRVQLDVLESHLRSATAARLDATRPPRVIVLAGSVDRVLQDRLAQLDPERVDLLVLCEVKSQRTTTTHWIPALDPVDAADPVPTFERFVAALPDSEQRHVQDLAQRLLRLDVELTTRVVAGRLCWRFRGDDLVQVEHRGTALEVVVHGRSAQPLANGEDLEDVVAAAIASYFDLTEARTGDEPGLAQVELIPRHTGAVLTREEIDAFRD
tara:strand:+ start:259 stop:1113 length:855 start_codon:yes stop_codon:yes gene_type:complete